MTDETEDAKSETDQTTEDITSLSIDDVFNDSDTPEPEPKGDEPEPEPKGEEPKGEDEPKPEDEPEPPSGKDESVPIAALHAERRKRQEAEAKLRDIQEGKKIPDPIEDPEGYSKHIESVVSARSLDDRITMSRELYAELKDDYAEKEKVFMQLVGAEFDEDGKLLSIQDEGLLKKFHASKNPAKFAYDTANEHLEIQKLRDPKYKEQLENEIRQKILDELNKDKKDDKPKDKTVKATEVPDLTQATASGSNSIQKEKEVSELDDVFEGSVL